MIEATIQWISGNRLLLQYLGIFSIVAFIATPFLVSLLVIRIPHDYFISERDHFGELGKGYHPVAWVLLKAAKNTAGIILVLAGIAMLVLPGQGIITILIGLVLIDFPLKRRLELWLVRKHKVISAANWMRDKAGRPPLLIDDDEGPNS